MISFRKTVYLIDSENVGSAWIGLLSGLSKKDRIVVFYTENSPHFAAESGRVITEYREYDISWEKCFTGNNGLDFQLVSLLGYYISKRPKDTYVIMSNDSGYDAVVKYWMHAGIDVKRVQVEVKRISENGQHRRRRRKSSAYRVRQQERAAVQGIRQQDAQGQGMARQEEGSQGQGTSGRVQGSQGQGQGTGWRVAGSRGRAQEPQEASRQGQGAAWRIAGSREQAQEPQDQSTAWQAQELQGQGTTQQAQELQGQGTARQTPESHGQSNAQGHGVAQGSQDASGTQSREIPVECVLDICRSISIHKLSRIHDALVALLGAEDGREVYCFLRDNKEFHEKLDALYLQDRNERVDNYYNVVMKYNGLDVGLIPELKRILSRYDENDLNGLHAALLSHFGKELGTEYYNILKGHVRVIRRL